MEGEWTISYNAGKIQYGVTLTDEELARLTPANLLTLATLIRRPHTDALRALVHQHLTRGV